MKRRAWLRASGAGIAVSAIAASFGVSRLLAAASMGAESSPDEVMPLWPDSRPLEIPAGLKESIVERSTVPSLNDRAIVGICQPRLNVFRPAASVTPNGSWVLIAPGGGYRWVVVDREGFEMARWFAARGITAFVLYYRSPGDGWKEGATVALTDAQRAVRLIRHHALKWKLDAARGCVLGFSAGGHLAADLLTRHALLHPPGDAVDKLSARPDLGALMYPVISMHDPHAHRVSRERLLGAHADSPRHRDQHSPHLQVSAETPPCFLVHAEDDKSVPVENTLLMRAALQAHKVPTQCHLFESGGHGFGLRNALGKPAEAWPELLHRWMRARGWPP